MFLGKIQVVQALVAFFVCFVAGCRARGAGAQGRSVCAYKRRGPKRPWAAYRTIVGTLAIGAGRGSGAGGARIPRRAPPRIGDADEDARGDAANDGGC